MCLQKLKEKITQKDFHSLGQGSSLRHDRNANDRDREDRENRENKRAHIFQQHTMVFKCLSVSEICSQKVGRKLPSLGTALLSMKPGSLP